MEKVIYMNNDTLTVVHGKCKKSGQIKVKHKQQIALPEGTVLNGVILDKEIMKEKLKPLKKALNKGTLLLNSSYIVIKKLDMPELSDRQLLSVVKKEFTLLEQNEPYIYDFSRTDKKHETPIIACAAPSAFIKSYETLFQEIGITLKKIDIVPTSSLKWVKTQKVLQGKCCVLNIMEQNTMTSFLLQNGNYMFHNKTRLVQEAHTEGYSQELGTSLLSIIQFHTAQKLAYPIEASYYIGLDEEVVQSVEKYIPMLENRPSIASLKCNGNEAILYPLAAMQKEEHEVNFYKGIQTGQKPYWKEVRWIRKAFYVAMLVGIMGTSALWVHQVNLGYKKDIEAIQSALVEPAHIEALQEVRALESYKSQLAVLLDTVEDRVQSLQASRLIDGKKINQIVNIKTDLVVLNTMNYNSEDRQFLLGGVAKGVHETERFVTRLKATGLFETVDYAGYSRSGESDYQFSITTYLKEVEVDDNGTNQ